VFQTNPIQNDEDVKKKVERYERARIVTSLFKSGEKALRIPKEERSE
jgi:hypothetical protein